MKQKLIAQKLIEQLVYRWRAAQSNGELICVMSQAEKLLPKPVREEAMRALNNCMMDDLAVSSGNLPKPRGRPRKEQPT